MLSKRPLLDKAATKASGAVEARATVVSGRRLWVAEPQGSLLVKDASTGAEVVRVKCEGVPVSLCAVGTDVWVGCRDGVVRIFRGVSLVEELDTSLTRGVQRNEVRCMAYTPHLGHVLLGCKTGDLLAVRCNECPPGGSTPGHTVRNVYRSQHPITAIAVAMAGSVYIGDATGGVSMLAPSDDGSTMYQVVQCGAAHRVEITSLLWLWRNDTLWCGAKDGRIVVLPGTREWSAPLATMDPHRGDVRLCEGGAPVVVSGGSDGTLCLWGAFSFDLVGTLPHHHTGSVRSLCLSGVTEVGKVWTAGADHQMTLLEIPGTDEPAERMQPPSLLAKAYARQHELQLALREMDSEVMSLKDQLREREDALREALRKEDTAGEHVSKLLGDLRDRDARIRVFELQVERMELEGLEREKAIREAAKKREQLEKELGEVKQKLCDKEVEVTTAKDATKEKAAELDKVTREKTSLATQVKQLETKLEGQTKSVETSTKQTTDMKGEVMRKDVQLKKVDADLKDKDKALAAAKAAQTKAESQVSGLEANIKSLKDQLLVRQNEVKQLTSERDDARKALAKAQADVTTAARALESESRDKRHVADTAVLARNETELLKRERDELISRVHVEYTTGQDQAETVQKLRWQVDQLREALEQERGSNKLLEHQYTIFQFVINSRGELVTSIWSLHDLLKRVKASLREVEDFVKRNLLGFLKSTVAREDGTQRFAALRDAVCYVDDKTSYIISNYFTEYEKLHFGIPSYRFYPDTRRPNVAGSDLLGTLQEVTPAKRYSKEKAPPGTPTRPLFTSPQRVTSPQRGGSPQNSWLPVTPSSPQSKSPVIFRTPAR